MSDNHLTLLQLGVIRRLRATGFVELAQRARAHWSRGEPLADIPRPRQDDPRSAELIRANEQAERISRQVNGYDARVKIG